MKSVCKNIIETSTVTLDVGAENPSYPLYRVCDRDIGKLFKANAAGAVRIKADQGASVQVGFDRLILPAGHNLDGVPFAVQSSPDDSTYTTVMLGLFSAGLNVFTNQEFDQFDNSYINPAHFGVVSQGDGSVTEAGTLMTCDGGATVGDYAWFYLKKYGAYLRTAKGFSAAKWKARAGGTTGYGHYVHSVYQAASPSGSFNTSLARVGIQFYYPAAGSTYIRFTCRQGSTTYYWNPGTMAWQTTVIKVMDWAADTYAITITETNGTGFRIALLNSSYATQHVTSWTPWSLIDTDGNSEWIAGGETSGSATAVIDYDWMTTGGEASDAARYLRVRICAELFANPVELPELFLSPTYTWERLPARPAGPFDDVFTVEHEQTASGLDRFLLHGNPRRQRVYRMQNAGSAQKTNILDLNSAWQGAKPFWLCDHEDNWIYGRLRNPLNLREEGYSKYSFDFDFEEVIG
jgi:hypothetical protein